jgi:phosphate acetyltransferase
LTYKKGSKVMANSLYITTSEADSGQSHVTLGILNLVLKKFKRVGFFRPFVSVKADREKEHIIGSLLTHFKSELGYEDTYGMTKEEAADLLICGRYDELMEKIIKKYMAVREKCDFVIVEGTSYRDITSSFELDLNADIAKNLGTPILIVLNAFARSSREITQSYVMANNFYSSKGNHVIGTVINRVNLEVKDELTKKYADVLTIKDRLFEVIPYSTGVDRGSALITKTFRESVDTDLLWKGIEDAPSGGITYKMFEYDVLKRALKNKQHIVLPEGEDDRVLQAAEVLKNKDIVDVTILGDQTHIDKRVSELGLNLDGIPIVDPKTFSKMDDYANKLFELRKHKGLTIEKAKELLQDVSYLGTMMLYMGDVDGMVSGAAHTTGETIRPALQIIKTRPGCSVVSSVFFMCLEGRITLFGDCAVNPNPTPSQLAEIAISSAETAKAFDIDPRVAFLSYSSGSSGVGADVELVREATGIAKELRPDLKIEGPIQYDAAVDMNVAKKKLPDSEVAGKATVFVFPDLNTGNNTYKAVQRESGAEAIGPILQGLNKAMNDLSRGCSVLDIVNTTILTSIQAHSLKEAKK